MCCLTRATAACPPHSCTRGACPKLTATSSLDCSTATSSNVYSQTKQSKAKQAKQATTATTATVNNNDNFNGERQPYVACASAAALYNTYRVHSRNCVFSPAIYATLTHSHSCNPPPHPIIQESMPVNPQASPTRMMHTSTTTPPTHSLNHPIRTPPLLIPPSCEPRTEHSMTCRVTASLSRLPELQATYASYRLTKGTSLSPSHSKVVGCDTNETHACMQCASMKNQVATTTRSTLTSTVNTQADTVHVHAHAASL